jgi:adenine phosphoribosyltransferase
MELTELIRDVPDFPKPGIIFKDIMPLLENGPAFRQSVDEMATAFDGIKPDKIVGAEARGFIFGAALAYKLSAGFVAVRKPGKLPHKVKTVTYELEYGTDSLCVHEDAIKPGESVLIVDDLLATGGTVGGVVKLMREIGAEIAGVGFLIELDFLKGRAKLEGLNVQSLIHVSGD